MNFKEITELIKLVNKENLSEFKVRDGEFELTIRSAAYAKKSKSIETNIPSVIPLTTPAPAAPIPESAPVQAAPDSSASSASGDDSNDNNYIEVKSPMVGTFYRASSPDKPAYVKVGDTIGEGDVLCIIEAMKLFNEIESEVSGKIVKILVDDASPVEYEQPLFLIDPNG